MRQLLCCSRTTRTFPSGPISRVRVFRVASPTEATDRAAGRVSWDFAAGALHQRRLKVGGPIPAGPYKIHRPPHDANLGLCAKLDPERSLPKSGVTYASYYHPIEDTARAAVFTDVEAAACRRARTPPYSRRAGSERFPQISVAISVVPARLCRICAAFAAKRRRASTVCGARRLPLTVNENLENRNLFRQPDESPRVRTPGALAKPLKCELAPAVGSQRRRKSRQTPGKLSRATGLAQTAPRPAGSPPPPPIHVPYPERVTIESGRGYGRYRSRASPAG